MSSSLSSMSSSRRYSGGGDKGEGGRFLNRNSGELGEIRVGYGGDKGGAILCLFGGGSGGVCDAVVE